MGNGLKRAVAAARRTREFQIADLVLPDGWTAQPYDRNDKDRIVLRHANGFMTLDMEARLFRSGISALGKPQGPAKKPMGRGWQQSLANAAVKWLSDVWEADRG